MSDLDIAAREAGHHLEQIQNLFKRAKVTLLCRTPENDEADFMLTDDDPAEAIKAIQRRVAAQQEGEQG